MGAILTEAGGALRTLFIQRTPDRTETDGVETLLDLAGRAHSRYGTRQPSWYLKRPDQYMLLRAANSRSWIRFEDTYAEPSPANRVEAQCLERHENLAGRFAWLIFKTHADAEQTHMLFLSRVCLFEQNMKNFPGCCMA
jgi:hypothetical protein